VAPVRALAAFITTIITIGMAALLYFGMQQSVLTSARRNPDSRAVVVQTQRQLYAVVGVVILSGMLVAYLLLSTG